MIRAIYKGHTKFENYTNFDYNSDTRMFHSVDNTEVAVSFESVMKDKDFAIFISNGELAFQVETVDI